MVDSTPTLTSLYFEVSQLSVDVRKMCAQVALADRQHQASMEKLVAATEAYMLLNTTATTVAKGNLTQQQQEQHQQQLQDLRQVIKVLEEDVSAAATRRVQFAKELEAEAARVADKVEQYE